MVQLKQDVFLILFIYNNILNYLLISKKVNDYFLIQIIYNKNDVMNVMYNHFMLKDDLIFYLICLYHLSIMQKLYIYFP